jgi:hypothetical protein
MTFNSFSFSHGVQGATAAVNLFGVRAFDGLKGD